MLFSITVDCLTSIVVAGESGSVVSNKRDQKIGQIKFKVTELSHV